MNQEELQTYDSDTSFRPNRQVDLIPAIDRENSRQSSADQEALAQVRRNNQTRVENSKRAGQDLIALSKLSKTLTDQLIERQEGINEDEKAQGVVDGYQDYLSGDLDTTQVTQGIEAAREQDVVAQDVSSEVLGDVGENYEAAATISKATTWREVGRRQGFAMAAVAGYDSFVDEQLAGVQFNSSAEYAAARAQAQKAFFKEAGLSGVKPAFLAKNVYPQIMQDDLKAVDKWKLRFAVDDSAKTQDELFNAFTASKDVPSLLSALRNTVDVQGNPLGYRGAWERFDKEIVDMRKAGVLSDSDITNMENQPIPGDAKGRTYGELHGTKFTNIRKQVAAQTRVDWDNSEKDRKMEFQKAEQEFVEAYLNDPDGYTDDQLDDAITVLEKQFGMSSSELATLKNTTVDADTRKVQLKAIENLYALNLLTPDRLREYDPKLQQTWMSRAQEQERLAKANNNYKLQTKAIEEMVKYAVKSNPMAAADPNVGLMVGKMQQEFQQRVSQLAIAQDPDPAGNAYRQIQAEFEARYKDKNPSQTLTQYKTDLYPTPLPGTSEAKARINGISRVLTTAGADALDTHLMLSESELKKITKGFGKPGWSPGATAEFIGAQLGVDPITVINRQIGLVPDMEPLPPSPALEYVNQQTPAQQQLLFKYKTPERSVRGLASDGYRPEIVPMQYGQIVQDAASKHGVDPSILSGLIETESAWNPNAISPAGAKGLAQFMDPTAAEFGVDVRDPKSSIDGAARYLKYLVNYFKGDMRLAIFAYNGGMGNIQKFGGPIPGNVENQEYYTKVMNGAYKYGYGKQTLSDPGVMRPAIAAKLKS